MWRYKVEIGLVCLLATLMTTIIGSGHAANAPVMGNASPISVEIKPAKEVYEMGEPLLGHVFVNNSDPFIIKSEVFSIKVFHEEKEVYSYSHVMQIVPKGKTRIPFRFFHIPSFTKWGDSSGSWLIKITLQNRPYSPSAKALVKVIPREIRIDKSK